MDEKLFKKLIETFNSELELLLQNITNNLQNLPVGKEEIARSGRNIKVSASAIEANDISRMAQLIEKLYSSMAEITPEIITLTIQATEQMRKAMQAFSEKKPLPSEFNDLINQLQKHLPVEEKAKVAEPIKKKPEIKVEPAPPPASSKETEFLNQIIEVFKAELEEKLLVITNNLIELESSKESKDLTQIFNEIFRAAHNIKGSGRGVGALEVGEIAHHVETLFSALQNKSVKISPEIINLCLKAVDAMRTAMQCFSEKQPLPFDLKDLLNQLQQCANIKSDKSVESIKPEPAKPIQQATPSKPSEYESIRVSLNTLERVSAYMEEMQINKIAIEDHYSELKNVNIKTNQFIQSWKKQFSDLVEINELVQIGNNIDRINKELCTRINELKSIFNSLQDEVRMLRLVPVTMQLSNLPRIVRDLAYNLHKQVNLEIKDNNVKIDKMVLDGLKDPIVHILRNSIDHGIEDSKVRKSVGKPESGLIKIDVSEEDSQILFKISDDGGGINTDQVARTALRHNILTKSELESMSQEDILELIFRPGFSTKESATDVSGRGVGLDAVRSNLTSLKGQVSLTTEVGKGTTFYLRVPLTLATERGLIVKNSGQLFVILTNSIESLLLSHKNDIIDVEGSRSILINKRPILINHLSKILELEEKKGREDLLPTVIIKKDWNTVAILVDEIIGEREIVLKPLLKPLTNIPCVIGATLSGSNQIIFVLNSNYIINKSKQIKMRCKK